MSATTSGSAVVARAYLAAGNFKLVEAQLKPILAADPSDKEACGIWCDMLARQKKFLELETFALVWLGHDARAELAYRSLICSFVARRDHKNATKILKRYRELFPGSIASHQAFQIQINLSSSKGNSRKQASICDEAITYFTRAGDEKSALWYQSQAAFCRGNFSEAVRLAELWWAAGYTATNFASYMALICFRSFRFAKSRHYSRLALRSDPAHAVATELIVLSWLVWFPPFLVAHAWLWFACGVNRRDFGAVVVSFGIIVASVVAAINLLERFFPILMPPFVLMILYCAYMPSIGAVAKAVNRFRRRSVRLSKY